MSKLKEQLESGKFETLMLPLEELKPFDKNPRKNDEAVPSVLKSIQEYGWNQPIVVDQHNRIVVGHTRYKVARVMNMKKVPVWKVELTEDEFLGYNLSDNKTGEISDWDYEMLRTDFSDMDETYTGFSKDEIKALMGNFSPDDFDEKLDAVDAEDWELEPADPIKNPKPEFGGKGTKQMMVSYSDSEYEKLQKLLKTGMKETGAPNVSELVKVMVEEEYAEDSAHEAG